MKGIRQILRAGAIAALLTFAAGTGAQDQPNLDFANCRAQSDPDIAFQMDLCTAHAGCNLVVKAYKACTAVRSFTERLRNSIAEGVNTLFGSRSGVQPENIWDAVQTDNTRRLDALPEVKARSSAIREALAKSKERFVGTDSVLYGEVKDGDHLLRGWSTIVAADGAVYRGQFGDSGLEGQGEWFLPTRNGRGVRVTGEFIKGRLQGGGAAVYESGTVNQGRYEAGAFVEGKRSDPNGASWQEGRFDPVRGHLIEGSKYAADGSLTEKGTFRDGQLYVGERYANGQVVASVNRPREQMQQAEIAERTRREAAERAATAERTRQEAAAREAAERTRQEVAARQAAERTRQEAAATSVAGAPPGVCKDGGWHDPAYEAALARIPRNDPVTLIRGAIVGIDLQLHAIRTCPGASRDPAHIRALENQRESALRACRQISARDNCLVSPFR